MDRCQPPSSFLFTSTVDDLSYSPSSDETNAQISAMGRKSWKTMKGKGEAVWPSFLEAVLLEALEKYQPDGTMSERLQGRFPLRNKFISDYILEMTGKVRTPRQVASRLQQLKNNLSRNPASNLQQVSDISDDRTNIFQYSEMSQSYGRSVDVEGYSDIQRADVPKSSSSSAMEMNSTYTETYPSRIGSTDITVDFTLDLLSPCTVVYISISGNQNHLVQTPSGMLSAATTQSGLSSSVCPTATLKSPAVLCTDSIFSIFCEENTSPVYTEMTSLSCSSISVNDGSYLYSTLLIPNYWSVIASSANPERFTIKQDISWIPGISSHGSRPGYFASSSQSSTNKAIHTTIYKFVNTAQRNSIQLSPRTIPPHNPSEMPSQRVMAQNYVMNISMGTGSPTYRGATPTSSTRGSYFGHR